MSGTTTEYGLDTTLELPAEELDWGGDVAPVFTEAPEPDETFEPPGVGSYGRRLQLILRRPITHEPLGEVRTFRCERWSDEHGAPGEIVGTASVWDPAWTLVASQRRTIRGRSVSLPDLKGVEVSLVEEGEIVKSGIFQQPTAIDGSGRIALRAVGPEAVWDERTLGETEQYDFLEGRGSFPTASLAGWSFEAGIQWEWNTTTPWEGDRSLRVRSTDDEPHWVYSPAVTMPGQQDWVRHPVASALVRSEVASPYVFVGTFVTLGGAPVRSDFTLDNLGQASEDDTDWQGPITSRGWLTPQVVDHSVRAGIWVPSDGSWVDIDYVRIQWPTQTGYVTPTDLVFYPARIMRDAQFREGGSPLGIATEKRGRTGTEVRLAWEHQDDNPVGEAIRSVTDRSGGPDVWITPSWVQVASPRRGRDRRDVALTGHTVRRASLSFDPGGEVDEMRALTDLGSGPARVLHGVDQPVRPNRRRIRQLTQVPPGLTFDAGREWTRGHAEWGARTPVSAEVVVDYDEGRRYGVGDGVLVAVVDGSMAWAGKARVRSRVFDPASRECTLQVGPDPVVAL